jgi:hypothetical protein
MGAGPPQVARRTAVSRADAARPARERVFGVAIIAWALE